MYDAGITLISNMKENLFLVSNKKNIKPTAHACIIKIDNEFGYNIGYFIELFLMFVYSNYYS